MSVRPTISLYYVQVDKNMNKLAAATAEYVQHPKSPAMDSKALKSQASLPVHLLRVALLIGKIPWRACQSDPRISYSLYIPQKQYSVVHQASRMARSRTQITFL